MHSLGELQHDIIVAQGTAIDRVGRVYIQPDTSVAGQVYIGGETNILIEGTVEL